MSWSRRPLDLVLDALVFVPLGILVHARTALPELAEAGRDHLASRVGLLRAAGRFVAAQAPGSPRPADRPSGAVRLTGAGPASPGGRSAPSSSADDGEEIVVVVEEAPASRGRVRLPIEGYDSLAASQVLARLVDLDDGGLRDVAAYEAAHRNRRTVLARIAQLRQA